MRTPQSQATAPSLGAILMQCEAIRGELTRMRESPFPPQAARMADLLEAYLDPIQRRLQDFHRHQVDPRKQESDEDFTIRLSESHVRRLTDLARAIFEAVRFVMGSEVARPGLQAAVQSLIDRHWPDGETGCPAKDVLALVRGRWGYNYTHQDVTEYLERCLFGSESESTDHARARDRLLRDEHAKYPRNLSHREWLGESWRRAQLQGEPPTWAALLSFPRVDRDDLLLSPMLVHELGHLIDFALATQLSDRKDVLPAEWFAPVAEGERELPPEDLEEGTSTPVAVRDTHERDASEGADGPPDGDGSDSDAIVSGDSTAWYVDLQAVITALRPLFERRAGSRDREPSETDAKIAVQTITDVLSECASDLIAVRLLGLPYVIALNEFLKTTAGRADPVVMPAKAGNNRSYPGLQFRIHVLARELFATGEGCLGYRELFEEYGPVDKTGAISWVAQYIAELAQPQWEEAILEDDVQLAIQEFAEMQVVAAVDRLAHVVRRCITAPEQPALSARVVDVIAQLRNEARPDLVVPSDLSYAELLAAGWCYQLAHGDEAEDQQRQGRYDRGDRLRINEAAVHYRKTNDLLFNALQTITQVAARTN